jgi:hypothetical protein
MPPHRIRGVKYNAETNDDVIEADSGACLPVAKNIG